MGKIVIWLFTLFMLSVMADVQTVRESFGSKRLQYICDKSSQILSAGSGVIDRYKLEQQKGIPKDAIENLFMFDANNDGKFQISEMNKLCWAIGQVDTRHVRIQPFFKAITNLSRQVKNRQCPKHSKFKHFFWRLFNRKRARECKQLEQASQQISDSIIQEDSRLVKRGLSKFGTQVKQKLLNGLQYSAIALGITLAIYFVLALTAITLVFAAVFIAIMAINLLIKFILFPFLYSLQRKKHGQEGAKYYYSNYLKQFGFPQMQTYVDQKLNTQRMDQIGLAVYRKRLQRQQQDIIDQFSNVDKDFVDDVIRFNKYQRDKVPESEWMERKNTPGLVDYVDHDLSDELQQFLQKKGKKQRRKVYPYELSTDEDSP